MKDGDDMFKQKHLLMFRLLHQLGTKGQEMRR